MQMGRNTRYQLMFIPPTNLSRNSIANAASAMTKSPLVISIGSSHKYGVPISAREMTPTVGSDTSVILAGEVSVVYI